MSLEICVGREIIFVQVIFGAVCKDLQVLTSVLSCASCVTARKYTFAMMTSLAVYISHG